MNIRFLQLAQAELDNAFSWYEKQTPELCFEFLHEVDRVVRRLKLYPESFPLLTDGLRRAQIHRFPYGVVYGLDAESLIVVAVAHLHREPFYWIERLN